MPQSISFDRASEYYDSTRAFPPGVSERVSKVLADMLGPGARILEIGVGTGRITLPLAQAGLHVSGIDISLKMMLKLVENARSFAEDQHRKPAIPDLVLGDAALLPFQTGVFDGILAVHVLHLMKAWRKAILESCRVLKPSGSFIMGSDWRPDDDPHHRIRSRWGKIISSLGYTPERAIDRDFSDVRAALQALGGKLEEHEAATWTTTYTLTTSLESLEKRQWSSTWQVPEDIFNQSMVRIRDWTKAEYGNLDAPISSQRKFAWQQYRFQ